MSDIQVDILSDHFKSILSDIVNSSSPGLKVLISIISSTNYREVDIKTNITPIAITFGVSFTHLIHMLL